MNNEYQIRLYVHSAIYDAEYHIINNRNWIGDFDYNFLEVAENLDDAKRGLKKEMEEALAYWEDAADERGAANPSDPLIDPDDRYLLQRADYWRIEILGVLFDGEPYEDGTELEELIAYGRVREIVSPEW